MSNLIQFLRQAATVGYNNATSGLVATTVNAAIDEVKVSIDANTADVADIRTLSGTVDGDTDLGTFTGTTIPDTSTIKAALQSLETSVELRALDADVIKRDGSVPFTGDQSLGGFKLTNIGTPTLSSDAVTKSYADGLSSGVIAKEAVRAATTASITLSGTQTIDGVALIVGDRVLVKDQVSAIDNGIYDVASGSWTRSSDADGTPASEVQGGMSTFVTEGTANINTVYRLTGTGDIIVGSDSQNFIIYSRAEEVTASTGLVKSGLDIQLADANTNGINVASGVLTANVDDVTIERAAGAGNPLQVKDLGITSGKLATDAVTTDKITDLNVTTAKLAGTSVTAAKLGSDVAGTGLTGGNGSALAVDFSTAFNEADQPIAADKLSSTSNGEGASIIGVEDIGSNFTATDVEGVLAEIDGRLDVVEGATGSAWVNVSAALTLTEGGRYLVDTSTSSLTLTLPASPSAGDEVIVRDASRNSSTNTIVVNRNGSNVGGLAEDLNIGIDGAEVHLVYFDASEGWTVSAV